MARQQKQIADEVPVSSAVTKSLFDRVAGFLDANDWNYQAFEDKGYFSMGCRIQGTSIRVIIDVTESEDWKRVLALATYPIFVPEHRRSAVAESLTRINYRTAFGNLEMDLEDGEVRVRTAFEVTGEFADSMIENALNSSIRTADHYFAPIKAIVFGNVAPDKALEMAEKPADATLQ